MFSFTFEFYIERNVKGILIIIKIKLGLSDIFFYEGESAGGKIPFGFDELKTFIEKRTRRKVKYPVLW
jgi:hypothetical protein